MLKKILTSVLIASASSLVANVDHYVVYHNENDFAGWPANEGLWQWGDEILTAFEVAKFVEIEKDHNIDRNSPKRIVFARSKDGGKTWSAEEHAEIAPPAYLGDESLYEQHSSAVREPRLFDGGYNFESRDFAMKLRGKHFYVSNNRGHDWDGPFILPEYDYTSEARTSYIVTGESSMLLFVTGRIDNNGLRYGRSLVLETTDGGKTFDFISWIGEDIEKNITERERENGTLFSIMPSAVELGDGHYVVALRQRADRRKWTDIYETKDNCRTWTKISLLEKGSSNPVTLLRLDDGRLVAVYGSRRHSPTEIVGIISEDGGHSWGGEVVLRNDGREWDIGYSRGALLPNGNVLAIYYFTTEEMPENFIGATIWEPEVKESSSDANELPTDKIKTSDFSSRQWIGELDGSFITNDGALRLKSEADPSAATYSLLGDLLDDDFVWLAVKLNGWNLEGRGWREFSVGLSERIEPHRSVLQMSFRGTASQGMTMIGQALRTQEGATNTDEFLIGAGISAKPQVFAFEYSVGEQTYKLYRVNGKDDFELMGEGVTSDKRHAKFAHIYIKGNLGLIDGEYVDIGGFWVANSQEELFQ